MCGIAGIAALGGAPVPTLNQVHRMCEAILHRGPDDEGLDLRGGVALGMRRLSIIDLAGGNQPLFNEDHTILCVFNGEIYNFKQLRNRLVSKGHIFRTHSDTEVIVHAYEEYGEAFPRHLNGMFAIALHDTNTKKLLLVRDHVGIKPLYYSLAKNNLIFGSEIKCLLASGLIDRALNMDALGQFMAWEYIPGAMTLLDNVHKLEPASILTVNLESSRITTEEYWDIPQEEPSNLSAADWEDRVDNLLHECVQRQRISDVPLGAFLSGGVDSSLVAAAMPGAQTFSIGFADPSYNELHWAQLVARHLGVDHRDKILHPDILELFNKLLYHMDDPIGDFSIFPTYLVSGLARESVTVVLSGDGGDELFGGYETYIADEKARQYAQIPSIIRRRMIEPIIHAVRPMEAKKGLINKAKRFIEGLEQPDDFSHARWRIFAGEMEQALLFTPEARQQISTSPGDHIRQLFMKAGRRHPLNKSLYVDLKSYLCDNILTKVDRMSMAVSLEARVPYLDVELVELAFSMPASLKVHKGTTKYLLKKVAARHLPEKCVYRPKEGFSIPIKQWLTTTLRPLMEELLDNRKIQEQGIFQAQRVNQLKQEHYQGTANHSHILWSLMMFHAWQRRWLEDNKHE
ncbi:MAG: asparagine synthase (glutamine-hydrolyzing) [Desulfobulbus sp.]|nr:MAG: asparagine synthase (glutamine-hydrolyzing) [Desulfobulbus sp.]